MLSLLLARKRLAKGNEYKMVEHSIKQKKFIKYINIKTLIIIFLKLFQCHVTRYLFFKFLIFQLLLFKSVYIKSLNSTLDINILVVHSNPPPNPLTPFKHIVYGIFNIFRSKLKIFKYFMRFNFQKWSLFEDFFFMK